ncbi:MAG TPA: hypothetical protein H9888_04645 [Candidatus Rikenella faecigallinarum]|uniref:Uncharacterized protein n=1 Tax=Candidatus Rikenella faecigallinarum TaxID=2838745 RepID=A0A9D1TYK0_9BACT|nr:hypothetical protein [Candidatus Rikenella faecigallinarum]
MKKRHGGVGTKVPTPPWRFCGVAYCCHRQQYATRPLSVAGRLAESGKAYSCTRSNV